MAELESTPDMSDLATKSGLLSEYQSRGHPGASPQEMFDYVFGPRMMHVGDLTINETATLAIAVGMKRKTMLLAGAKATDRLILIPTAAPSAGCEAINVYPAADGQVSVSYYTPALALGATFTIPLAVYRVI